MSVHSLEERCKKCTLINVYSLFFTACTGCYKAFGMESNKIRDSQITASSYKRYYEPNQARLHMMASASGNGAWCASRSYQQGEWLQVRSAIYKTVCFLICTSWWDGEGYQSDRTCGNPPLGCFYHVACEKIGIFSTKMKKKISDLALCYLVCKSKIMIYILNFSL